MIATAMLLFAGSAARSGEARPNVLFVAVDDLRPQLGCYGHERMQTPHLNRLARRGRLFERHYVQVPTCGASRYALLTGRRPSRPAGYGNGAFSLLPDERQETPASLPEMFRRNGYYTESIGKVSHSPDGRRYRKTTQSVSPRGDGRPEVPFAWDRVGAPVGPWETGWRAFFAYAGGRSRVRGKTPSHEAADVPDTGYPDGLIAQAAVDRLQNLGREQRPFFLAVGFYKPHLPFCAPQKYWDLYDRSEIGLAPSPEIPENVDPRISLHRSGELLGNYGGMPRVGFGTVSEKHARLLRHAYFACTSYVDAQIGKVLAALEEHGLADNTVVVVWGDHGWHLGDNGVWAKHTLHEKALRSALIVRTPEMVSPGHPTDGLVETIDLYPTLADLCELTPPDDLDGVSLKPLLEDPDHPGKTGAFGYWRRGGHVGRSLRTERYRLTRYRPENKPDATAQIELYDHRSDPHESANIAEKRPEVVQRLRRRLQSETATLPAH